MLIEYMKTDFEFKNDNGLLVQLVHDGWKQINVITSKAYGVRGGHYHKYNDECFYVVSGSFKLTLWKEKEKESYLIKEGEMFLVKPYVFHTFEYLEDTLLVSMYNNGVELDETHKDIWTN